MAYEFERDNIISIPRGSTYIDTVTLTTSSGDAYPLADAELVSQIRDMDGLLIGEFLCELSDEPGVVNRELADNITELLIPSINPRYVWGLKITANGITLPEIHGGVIVGDRVVPND